MDIDAHAACDSSDTGGVRRLAVANGPNIFANASCFIKPEFRDADADADTDVLARIVADTSDTRDFLKLQNRGRVP